MLPRKIVGMRALALLALVSSQGVAQRVASYFPPAGRWEQRSPAAEGVDSAKLQLAVDYALGHGSTWDFERDQVRTFGPPLGPLPAARASTNGIILRHGYVIAKFGDTKANDPVYSIAKSFLSTVAAVAVQRGLIRNVNDRVGDYIHDGGYDSPHNAAITWRNHLQQESEWEGSLWGKNADFVGREQFGNGARPPARHSRAGHLLRVQRRPHQSILAVAGAAVRHEHPRRAEDGDHGSDRRLIRVAVGAL